MVAPIVANPVRDWRIPMHEGPWSQPESLDAMIAGLRADLCTHEWCFAMNAGGCLAWKPADSTGCGEDGWCAHDEREPHRYPYNMNGETL